VIGMAPGGSTAGGRAFPPLSTQDRARLAGLRTPAAPVEVFGAGLPTTAVKIFGGRNSKA
jgi:hypothetical protein